MREGWGEVGGGSEQGGVRALEGELGRRPASRSAAVLTPADLISRVRQRELDWRRRTQKSGRKVGVIKIVMRRTGRGRPSLGFEGPGMQGRGPPRRASPFVASSNEPLPSGSYRKY